jgi:membrane associated rhomboid family serine protease
VVNGYGERSRQIGEEVDLMIPLGDVTRRPQHFPVITVSIIVLNAVVFVLELTGGDAFINRWVLVPAHLVADHRWITLLTAMFLHGGWLHLLSNMLFLWVFGPLVEDGMGGKRYLAFYLLGGLIAFAAQIALAPTSQVPMLGASGAIAAVMGAFLITYPRDQIRTVLVLGIFFTITRIYAIVLMGLWFLLQIVSAAGVLATTQVQQGGVAYLAHVAGFLFGAVAGRLLEDPARLARQNVAETDY